MFALVFVGNVLALALLLFFTLRFLMRQFGRERALVFVFILLGVGPLNGIRMLLDVGSLFAFFAQLNFAERGIAWGCISLMSGWALWRCSGVLAKAVPLIVGCSILFLPVSLVIMGIYQNDGMTGSVASGSVGIDAAHGPEQKVDRRIRRVVWLIFDELDYRLLFDARPSRLAVPNFDRLSAESVHFSQAKQAGDSTLVSLPTLLSGVRRDVAGSTIFCRDISRPEYEWEKSDSLMGDIRAGGGHTALISWMQIEHRLVLAGQKPVPIAVWQWQTLIETLPLVQRSHFVASLNRSEHSATLRWLKAQTLQAVTDPQIDFVVAHLSIPHLPGICPMKEEQPPRPACNANYIDNIMLADQVLGEIRQAMEQSGLWDETVVAVTSDHRWRSEIWRFSPLWTEEEARLADGSRDERVPFLVRMPGDSLKSTPCEAFFDTVRSRELLGEIALGEIGSSEQVVEFLKQH